MARDGIKARKLANGTTVYDVDTSTLRKRGFRTVAEARTARDKARDDARRGVIFDARTARMTVGEVAAAYLAAKSPRWSTGTRDQRVGEWRAMAPVFGERRVTELRVSDVQDWLDASTLGTRTLGNRLGLLRAILDRAAADYGIVNVARLAKPRRPSTRRAEQYAPEATDVAKLLQHYADDRRGIVLVLALGLGLRSGEARGLTLDRVDFTTGRVTIDRQLKLITARHGDGHGEHVAGRLFLAPPKAGSAGVVMASADVLDAIRGHVDRFGTGPHGLIATAARGGPMSGKAWSAMLAAARKATGVELRGHALRHAYGSWSIANGATVAEVAADLRHRKITTTLDFYVRADRPADAARSAGVMARVAEQGTHKPPTRGHLRAV